MVFLKRLVLIIDEFIEGELKMKLTTKKLRQIIREEVANTVKEAGYSQITRRQREDERNAGVDDVYSDSVRASPDEKVEWMIESLANTNGIREFKSRRSSNCTKNGRKPQASLLCMEGFYFKRC